MEVIKCLNLFIKTLQFCSTKSQEKSTKAKKYVTKDYTNRISSDLGYVSNTLSFPSIIYVDKPIGGCKILSQYFSRMLLILRHQA